MFSLRINSGCQNPELFVRRKHVCPVLDSHDQISFKKSVSDSALKGIPKHFLSRQLHYRFVDHGDLVLMELAVVQHSKPSRSPCQVELTVIPSIAVQIDGRIELLDVVWDERTGHQFCHPSVALNSIPPESDENEPRTGLILPDHMPI